MAVPNASPVSVLIPEGRSILTTGFCQLLIKSTISAILPDSDRVKPKPNNPSIITSQSCKEFMVSTKGIPKLAA